MTVHPRIDEPATISSDVLFAKALLLVDRSQAATLIDQWRFEYRDPAARVNRLPYTVHAVLTALACVMFRRGEPTVATLFRTLLDFTPSQLTRVGITPSSIEPMRACPRQALASFRDWLNRALSCLDSAPDQPARVTTLTEHDKIIRRRTPEQNAAYALAGERLTIIINRIVAGSIDPKYAAVGAGDLVVDETIIDTSSAGQIFGGTEKRRGSVYCGGYYRRDIANTVTSNTESGTSTLKKRGWGIGVTAVSAVGPPDGLHSRPVLFTGLSMHPPTPGSLAGLDEAVHHHRANGFDSRGTGPRARWPMITFDMGYLRTGLFEWQIANKYAAVHTYPRSWHTDFWAVSEDDGQRLGPIQLSGNWYCPSAAEISLGSGYVARLRDILATDDWQARDVRLRELLPRLMGVDRKPMLKRRTRGRPSDTENEQEMVPKMVLTCPAALGNIRCVRWDNPDTTDRIDLPLVDPPASMPLYKCCTQPTITVTLNEDQRRMQQFSAYAPGSYDHAIYCEAARSLTEQRFSLVKRRSVGGLQDLKYGARREPLVKLTFAMAFAVVNVAEIERFEADGTSRPESIRAKWNRLDRDLGKPAMRMPNRT